MLIPEDEAVELKAWVVRKLEDISDADSDVLADYVLALVRAETAEPELRLSAIANLEDFLQNKAEKFVDETFQAIHSKSFMPGHVPPLANTSGVPPGAPSGPRLDQRLPSQGNPPTGPSGASKKRSFNDLVSGTTASDPHYTRGDRQVKQLRRGGGRSGRHESFQGRPSYGTSPNMLSPGQFPLQATPGPSPDASDPLMAMMFQAMGMPILPVPPNASLAQSASPIGRSQQNASALNGTGKTRINARCRDYDTKGFCVRGDTCPFEHGNDHMVAPGQDVVEYDPKNSALTDIPAISPQGSSFAGHSMKSWSNDAVQSSYRGRGGTQDRGGSTRRQNRADFSQVGPNHDHSRTAIVVEQIPEDKFDEQSVRDFFSTYGAIATIDMRPYKHLAIVTYDDYWSAKQAYESPKVIFDNRFVKVYWYNPDSVPPSRSTTKHLSGTATSLIMQKTEEPEYKKEEFERSAMAAQKKLEEKKVLMKEAEAKRLALEKQKEELAQKQAEEKKKLLEKLAAKGAASNGAVNGEGRQTNGTVHTDDQASAQTKALRAQVSALEAEAKSLGLDTSLSEDPWPVRGRGRGRARGRGSYRGWEGFAGHGDGFNAYRGSPRGRGGFQASGAYNLDNRTKKVSVSGVEFDINKDEALRQHVLAIGEFEAIEPHADKMNTQVITFKDRKMAERFMFGPKDIPSVGKVELAWMNTPLASIRSTTQAGPEEGTMAAKSNTNGHQHAVTAETNEVDYDVAEEDDRWMAG